MVKGSELVGKKVVTSDGYFLGEVEGIEVDACKWFVTHLRILLSKQAVNDLRLEPPILWDVVLSLPTSFVREFGAQISLNIHFAEVTAVSNREVKH